MAPDYICTLTNLSQTYPGLVSNHLKCIHSSRALKVEFMDANIYNIGPNRKREKERVKREKERESK